MALLMFLVTVLPAAAQTQPPAADGRLRVFLDCSTFTCDFDYLRTEIQFIDYVRDRQDADVQVLVTTQGTGGGGTDYGLRFIGLRRFAGTESTLHYISGQSDSADQVRRGLARVLKAGLVPFAVQTSTGDRIEIGYSASPGDSAAAAAPARDPWNFWTFTAGMSGFFNGEQSYSNMSLNASVSANRTTEAWKLNLSASNRYSETNFELGD
ncbi:MAG: hypothetical protein M3483_03395, partial [Gemmatimonadota bacterium]|nr:hypothetical protein [Gemmatimonadota bacterium]